MGNCTAFSVSLVFDILMFFLFVCFCSALLMKTMFSEMQSGLISRLLHGSCVPSQDIWPLPAVIRKSYESIMEQRDSGRDPVW